MRSGCRRRGAALTLASVGAFAATTVKSSKSNSCDKIINVNDPKVVAACKNGGGTIGKNKAGKDVCSFPSGGNAKCN